MENENKALNVFIIGYDSDDKEYRKKLTDLLTSSANKAVNVLPAVTYKETDLKNSEAFIENFRKDVLAKADVCLVLIGVNTWKRKLIDWEIQAGMMSDANGIRKGFLGIILPTRDDFEKKIFSRYTIPPRLYDNHSSGYVKIYNWKEDAGFFERLTKKAFDRKDMLVPILTRPLFAANKSQTVKKW